MLLFGSGNMYVSLDQGHNFTCIPYIPITSFLMLLHLPGKLQGKLIISSDELVGGAFHKTNEPRVT